MTPKAFLKLVFFFFIVERLIAFISKLPLLGQIYQQLKLMAQYSDQAVYSAPAMRMALLGPVLDIVLLIALIAIVRNERILNKLSGWLAKN